MKRIGRKLAVPAFGIAVAAGGFAFLASNSVPTSYAGEGSSSVSGYTVSNIHYTTVPDDESAGYTQITAVTFKLDHQADPGQVFANLYEYGKYDGVNKYVPYDACTLDTGASVAANTFTCTPTGGAAADGSNTVLSGDVELLDVSAAQ